MNPNIGIMNTFHFFNVFFCMRLILEEEKIRKSSLKFRMRLIFEGDLYAKEYGTFMINLIAHWSALSRIIEREIKDLNFLENDFESNVEINYVPT